MIERGRIRERERVRKRERERERERGRERVRRIGRKTDGQTGVGVFEEKFEPKKVTEKKKKTEVLKLL